MLADLNGLSRAVGHFFSSLAGLHWIPLFVALGFYAVNLLARSRGSFNVLRAAYPDQRFRWREVAGAYIAAYGANGVIPARPGDLIRLVLLHRTVPTSTYPTLAASFLVENIFDTAIGLVVLLFALTQGVFPKPPDFSKLGAFDLSYLAGHPRLLLFVITATAVALLAAFAVLSARVKAFWLRVRQGFSILADRRRYLREVAALQFAGWLARFMCYWFMLDAFGIGGSVLNVMLVFGVSVVASLIPLTPGGAGVQQALLVTVFAGSASAATVAAYSVGQQIAIAAFTFALGLAAVVGIFHFRSFKDVIRAGRQQQASAGQR
ncbi:MAG: hypothetical protein QOF26_2867 [Baekduia sp.]|nr:hypothetical protein [Baekduia sp.]